MSCGSCGTFGFQSSTIIQSNQANHQYNHNTFQSARYLIKASPNEPLHRANNTCARLRTENRHFCIIYPSISSICQKIIPQASQRHSFNFHRRQVLIWCPAQRAIIPPEHARCALPPACIPFAQILFLISHYHSRAVSLFQ